MNKIVYMNLPYEAQALVARLEQELLKARANLEAIIEEGDSVSRFRRAIIKAEGIVQGLINRAKTLVMNQLQMQKLGRILPASKLTTALKDELRLHVRVADLDGFSLLPLRDLPENASKPTLEQRANRAIEQLNALAPHVHTDQETHQAPK